MTRSIKYSCLWSDYKFSLTLTSNAVSLFQVNVSGPSKWRNTTLQSSKAQYLLPTYEEEHMLENLESNRYLSLRSHTHAPSRTLRLATQSLVGVPRINLECYGRRSFSCAGPSLWNALPLGLRTQQDPDRFRRDLKTRLFNVASS